ncbi:DUF433 domain-containing protein [Thermomonas sp.]|uniref:DUF433 domain-containing protein n=1 Tax=Thermomonas sp. TaxID=1971895 RepID=UPI00262B9213|nr:DUF433 domain-containing protein [Thermomonas sp.]
MTNPTKTTYEHIVLDEKQRPVIEGTRMKVSHLVSEHLSWGWSPEELHFQHPHLTLGQIYSALAYYWDHQEQIDQQIAADLAEVDRLRSEMAETSVLAKLMVPTYGKIQTCLIELRSWSASSLHTIKTCWPKE